MFKVTRRERAIVKRCACRLSDCEAAADYEQLIAFSGARKTEAANVSRNLANDAYPLSSFYVHLGGSLTYSSLSSRPINTPAGGKSALPTRMSRPSNAGSWTVNGL